MTSLVCPECEAYGEIVIGGNRQELFSFGTEVPLEEQCSHLREGEPFCPVLRKAMTEAIERATLGH